MKKSIIFMIILMLTFIPIFSLTSSAAYYNNNLEDQDMRSEAYLLVNTDTDTVVFSQNADEQLQCASLVKIATAAVVVDNCDDLDAVVTATQTALSPLDGLYSASCDLQVGEQMSVRNLLYCMFLESANDAANVLAEYVGGSLDNFVVMMNDFADSLGCTNTNFTNAHGLDEDGEYSSANDMYLIMKYAMENSVLAVIASTVDYTVPATNMSDERELNTSGDIIEYGTRYYYEYAKYAKTGMTDGAARCAAVLATKDAYTYIGIIMGCPNECIDDCGYVDNTALYEVRRMFRWAFSNMSMTTIAEQTDFMTTVSVSLSTKTDYVRLVPETRIQALLLSSVDSDSLEFVYDVQEDVMAPVTKGDVLGTVQVKYADNVVAEANLVAGENVERSSILYAGYVLKNIFMSPVFLVIICILFMCVIIYILVIYGRHKQKEAQTRRRLREIKESKNDDNIMEFPDSDEKKPKKR